VKDEEETAAAHFNALSLVHQPPYSAEVKERVELYLYSTSGPLWPVISWTLPLPLPLPLSRNVPGGTEKRYMNP